jgi:hypothetical protein
MNCSFFRKLSKPELLFTLLVSTILVVYIISIGNVIAFKPITESPEANPKIVNGVSNQEFSPQQRNLTVPSSITLQNGTQLTLSRLPSGALSVEFADGSTLDLPPMIAFDNGSSVDTLTCVKDFTITFPYYPPVCIN